MIIARFVMFEAFRQWVWRVYFSSLWRRVLW